MEVPKTPRLRVPNFTGDEKALLAALIKNHPIIESKATDGKSVQKKKEAWKAITQDFNYQGYGHKRDMITLKRAWDNIKAFTRKTGTQSGTPLQTGVGATTPPQQGAVMGMVEEVAPVIKCEIEDPYDSNGALLMSLEQMKAADCIKLECEPNIIHPSGSHNVLTNNTATQDQEKHNTSVEPTGRPPRKPADYIRREGVLRIKNLEIKKRLETEILNSKLATQELKRQAAEMELQKNKILLEKALLELEILKNRND